MEYWTLGKKLLHAYSHVEEKEKVISPRPMCSNLNLPPRFGHGFYEYKQTHVTKMFQKSVEMLLARPATAGKKSHKKIEPRYAYYI
jgi:hypothetical protein